MLESLARCDDLGFLLLGECNAVKNDNDNIFIKELILQVVMEQCLVSSTKSQNCRLPVGKELGVSLQKLLEEA